MNNSSPVSPVKTARLSFISRLMSANDADSLVKARLDFRAVTHARPRFALMVLPSLPSFS